MNVHFMSLRGDWKTPRKLYSELDQEFQFDHDPCPTNPMFDGLETEWGECNFVNPPYGNIIGKWLERGKEMQARGKTSVFLIPSRTDTRWWHNYVMQSDEIRFIKGRLKFDEHKNCAPFPSAIVVMRGKK